MKGPESVWDQFIYWVPNTDGKTWDVFFLYSPQYMGPHEVVILDTGTGELKRQSIERGVSFHLIDNYLIDGKHYYKPGVEGREGESIYIYDPDKNEFIDGGRPLGPDLENSGGKWALDGGQLYGFGRLRGKDGAPDRFAAYRIDPKTLKGEVFKPLGELHANHVWLYSSVHKEGDWIYSKVGKAPWRLWASNLVTGEGKMLIETEIFDGDHKTIRLESLADIGGFKVGVNRPKGSGRDAVDFWLKDGKLSEKTGEIPPWSDKPPAAPKRAAKSPLPPKPEMRRTPPDADGNVEVTWRSAPDADWRSVKFDVIRHDQPIRRMVVVPGNRLFALAESYGQAVMFDLASKKRLPLGKTMSVYSMTAKDDTVYMSGYAGAVIWAYNANQSWTVNDRAADIGEGARETDREAELTQPESNPRQVARLALQTRMQNPWGGTVIGADGKVYAAGWIIRVGNGGALGWWDPKTQESGGLTDPFSAYPIYWMCGVSDGTAENRYLAISTKPTKDDKNPAYTPPQGKVFIFDTAGQKIIRELIPTAQSAHGPVVQAAPGVVMGFAKAPEGDGGLLWAADVVTGKTLWTRAVPVAPVTNFAMIRRNAGTILQRGPDGKIWTFMGKTLVRITPADGAVEIVGTVGNAEPGELTFTNGEIYLAGGTSLRRIDLSK
jgi:hypothetical protein